MTKKTTVAAIDIGTNSIHMIIADFDEQKNIDLVHRKREVIRLGESTFGESGNLSANAMIRGLAVLRNFMAVAKNFKAIVIAGATSAVREAPNGQEFVDGVKEELGLDIEVLSGEKEAQLIYLGITKALNLQNHLTLAFDIGGGSTEFILWDNTGIIFSKSIPIGAVRLTKMFFENGTLTEETIINCRNYIIKLINEEIYNEISIYKVEKFAGTAGTIFSTYLILEKKDAGSYLESINGGLINAKHLFELENKVLSKKTKEERIGIRCLENMRADIYPAGIIILSEIFKIFNIKQMALSTYAMREGMIINYANNK